MENIIKNLSEPFPEEAIQRTKKELTRKGYDTTGISYQYCVDRFNQVLADNWKFNWEIIHQEKGAYRTGVEFWDITVKVDIIIKENVRSCVGGHIGMTFTDALKGAITNGFKKTAAFWGVGREAYAGTLDDDNYPLPEKNEERLTEDEKKKIATEEIKQVANEKIQNLSEEAKAFFKENKYTKAKIFEWCEKRVWDDELIARDIKQAKILQNAGVE